MFVSARRPQRRKAPTSGDTTDGFPRARRSEQRRGLLVEDELKTDAAVLIQDAFRGLLATLFYLFASVTHDVVVYGRENIAAHHPTILISNHKRDLDSLVLQGIAYFGRGITNPNRRLAFALREDVFWRGFLTRYARHSWLHRLLGWIDVRPHMHLLKAFPIGHLTTRQDLPRLRAQLKRFAWLLDHGRDLYWTPEGGLTVDGHFGRIRAGLYRVIQQTEAELTLLPIAVFYDYMTTLRTRCFVRIGPEVAVDRSLSRPQIEELARRSILSQMTANIGHLMAAVLRDMPDGAAVSVAELEALVSEQARRFRQSGLCLDPRLTMRSSFRRRLRHFLGYAERQDILRRDGARWFKGLGERHPEMVYVLNELADVEPLFAGCAAS